MLSKKQDWGGRGYFEVFIGGGGTGVRLRPIFLEQCPLCNKNTDFYRGNGTEKMFIMINMLQLLVDRDILLSISIIWSYSVLIFQFGKNVREGEGVENGTICFLL